MALELVRWLAGTWLLWRIRTCGADTNGGSRGVGSGLGGRSGGPPAPSSPGPPAAAARRHLDLVAREERHRGHGRVTVVIPARDEEANLPRLLKSLADQDARPAGVIVVDDGSRDATADVARSAGATVVAAGPLPAGWTGKSWACARGAEAAADMGATRCGTSTGASGDSGDGTIVFLDADTWLAPGGMARLLDEHDRRGGLLSVQPFHQAQRPYEALSAFFNVVSMMGVGAFTPRRHTRPSGAFGPCLVCSATDYATAGGHAHPDGRGRVVEDVALAERFAGTGLPVSVLGGRGTISFRMYPGGLPQLVEGWTKNFATGAGSTRTPTFVLISLWLSGCMSAAWSLPAPAAAVVYMAYAGQLAWMLRRIGRFGWWPALLYPIPLAFFVVVFARSLVLTHVRGEVRWRGRTISTRATAAPRVEPQDARRRSRRSRTR